MDIPANIEPQSRTAGSIADMEMGRSGEHDNLFLFDAYVVLGIHLPRVARDRWVQLKFPRA